VVIDEEQRFGVMHKEKFKQLRRMVDVLTLERDARFRRTLYPGADRRRARHEHH